MSDPNNAGSAEPRPTSRRRASIVDMFSPRSNASTSVSSSPPSAAVPTTPGLSHRRSGSITTLGLAGTGQSQTSPYNAFAKQRRASISTSSVSGSPEFRNSFEDGAAVIEEDESRDATSPPANHFARRVSFGAQALRDVRQGGSQTGNGGGEGFNWSEALRDKTKRAPSFSAGPFHNPSHQRAGSTSTAVAEPPKEMPKAPVQATPPRLKKPDQLGERMLRGDFMMD